MIFEKSKTLKTVSLSGGRLVKGLFPEIFTLVKLEGYCRVYGPQMAKCLFFPQGLQPGCDWLKLGRIFPWG